MIRWLKVSDEVNLPGRLRAEERAKLAAAFANKPGSPWRIALDSLGLPAPEGEILRFVDGVPYFNATALSLAVRPPWWRALRAQWRVEKLLSELEPELPAGAAAIQESVTLGLAVQLVAMRLPAVEERVRASWLMNPASAPKAARATVGKLLTLQGRRTRLSSAWEAMFSPGHHEPIPADFPSEFLNEPPLDRGAREIETPVTLDPVLFRGIPISPGKVEGVLWGNVMPFAQARPSTVEEFVHAAAIAFAEGGALSHACCIAREQGLPCVSGLGKVFWRSAEECRAKGIRVEVTLDGEAGTLLCRPRA